MSNYAKLINGMLYYAPHSVGNILGYNLESNRERLLADGYKPVITLSNKDKFTDCEGYYSFEFTETEKAITERAVYHQFSYEELRRKAYPSVEMLCDAWVKINSGDAQLAAEGQKQMDVYIQSCLDVKEKYPKN